MCYEKLFNVSCDHVTNSLNQLAISFVARIMQIQRPSWYSILVNNSVLGVIDEKNNRTENNPCVK